MQGFTKEINSVGTSYILNCLRVCRLALEVCLSSQVMIHIHSFNCIKVQLDSFFFAE